VWIKCTRSVLMTGLLGMIYSLTLQRSRRLFVKGKLVCRYSGVLRIVVITKSRRWRVVVDVDVGSSDSHFQL